MGLQLLRIDDRLIHGQVVIGWVKSLRSERILLCDNDVANSDWERELYLSCVTDNVETLVLNTQDTFAFLDSSPQLEKTILLVKSPFVLQELIDYGFKPSEVNIGGIHFTDHRKEYLPYLFLTEEELQSFQNLSALGIQIYCQDVPTSKRYFLSDLSA